MSTAAAVVVAFLLVLLLLHHHEDAPLCRPVVTRDYSNGDAGSTGHRFLGSRVRAYHGVRAVDSGASPTTTLARGSVSRGVGDHLGEHCRCTRWAVVTTISPPSEAVLRASRLSGCWCLVVVGDLDTPATYDGFGRRHRHVVYLSPDDQARLGHAFVDALPFGSFARKNVGYLYAILGGARAIWDFDDDNLLVFFAPAAEGALPRGPVLDAWIPRDGHAFPVVRAVDPPRSLSFNAYPSLGKLGAWPRGFPLSNVTSSRAHAFARAPSAIAGESLGVLQSLAHHQPDLDAIYRLTHHTPFFFAKVQDTPAPLLVPPASFAPYNAQATLHMYRAFWALYLPISVAGRVSDIWRSYVAQRLFREAGLRWGYFSRPLVVQDRNAHDPLADFQAELHLYQRTEALLSLLDQWVPRASRFPNIILELWIELYERGYVESKDVELVKMWLETLIAGGYTFPQQAPRNTSKNRGFHTHHHYRRRRQRQQQPQPQRRHHNDDDDDDDVAIAPAVSCPNLPGESFTLLLPHSTTIHDGADHPDLSATVSDLGQRVLHIPTRGGSGGGGGGGGGDATSSRRAIAVLCSSLAPSPSSSSFYCGVGGGGDDDDDDASRTGTSTNISIIYAPSYRYNDGLCTPEAWHALNARIRQIARSPKDAIGAFGLYAREYLKYYIDVDPVVLERSSRRGVKRGVSYTGRKAQLWLFGTAPADVLAPPSPPAGRVIVPAPRSGWSPAELLDQAGVVYMPSAVSSRLLADVYQWSIPLFAPSLRYFVDHRVFGPSAGLAETPDHRQDCSSATAAMRPQPNNLHPYNPNVRREEDPEAELYWLQFSDFYSLPHITYFDNATHLHHLISNTNYAEVHQRMLKANARRWQRTASSVCAMMSKMVQVQEMG